MNQYEFRIDEIEFLLAWIQTTSVHIMNKTKNHEKTTLKKSCISFEIQCLC